MWDLMRAGAAGRTDPPEPLSRGYRDFGLVAFAFVALIGAELMLIITIPGANYRGADGTAAQAEILATLEFAKLALALFDKELATEISGAVALTCYAILVM
jgi:hypothetical protein